MNIEDEKKRLIDLLRASYQAHILSNTEAPFFATDPSQIRISGNTLEKFGFNYREGSSGFFWGILCPNLKAEGYLIEYSPFSPISESDYFSGYIPEYWERVKRRDSLALKLPYDLQRVAQAIASGGGYSLDRWQTRTGESAQKILDEIEEIGRELNTIKETHYGEIDHLFTVNEKKMSDVLALPRKHIVIEDTPEGATWRSLQIRFTDGRTLLASFPKQAWNRAIGAGELGLEKKGSQRPKEQWLLLMEAARDNGNIRLQSKGNAKETKRRQINTLQHLFNAVFPKLDGQPFETSGGDAYKTTFVIEPEQTEDDL